MEKVNMLTYRISLCLSHSLVQFLFTQSELLPHFGLKDMRPWFAQRKYLSKQNNYQHQILVFIWATFKTKCYLKNAQSNSITTTQSRIAFFKTKERKRL